MNRDKIYLQWIEGRRQVPVPDGFVDRVMAGINDRERAGRPTLFEDLGERSFVLTRWAAALGLIALGVYRIVFVTANLLMGSTL